MRKDISFRSLTLEELINLPDSSLDHKMCPALFFAVTAMRGQKNNIRSITLASIFQYVFMANRIHRLVSDEAADEHDRQYPVLVGDFMFGQAFSKLCEHDLFVYSSNFIRLIETMNEGVLMRWRLKNKNITLKEYRDILGKERAALTALIGKLGCEIAGIEETYSKKVEDFGYYLGMAWAAWDESLGIPIIQEYLNKAKSVISELRDIYPTRSLQEIFDFFNNSISPNVKIASS